jgi:hypothetical protein
MSFVTQDNVIFLFSFHYEFKTKRTSATSYNLSAAAKWHLKPTDQQESSKISKWKPGFDLLIKVTCKDP